MRKPERVLYFGCWGEPGHFYYEPSGLRFKGNMPPGLLPEDIDGKLCPVDPLDVENQVEGHASLQIIAGWTVLAFWDRSGDARLGANSIVMAQGNYSIDEMIAALATAYPQIAKRIDFPIVRVA